MLTSVKITKADIDGFLQQLTETGEEGMLLHTIPADAHNILFVQKKDGSFMIMYESSSDCSEKPAFQWPSSDCWETLQGMIKADAGLAGE